MRYSSITVIQTVLFIIKLVLTTTWDMFLHLCPSIPYHSAADVLFRIAMAYITAYYLYCFVWKFWLLRWNVMLQDILIQSEWKSIIDHNGYSPQNTFYAKHKRTLGDKSWTMYMWLAVATLFTTFYVVAFVCSLNDRSADWIAAESLDEPPGSVTVSLLMEVDYIIPLLILIVIYLNTPTFEDHFYIRQEMKYVFFCLIVVYCCYYSGAVMQYLIPSFHTTATGLVVLFMINHLIIGAQFVAMLTSTFWVNRRCEKIIGSKRYRIHHISDESGLSKVLDTDHCVEIIPKIKKIHDEISKTETDLSFNARTSKLPTPSIRRAPVPLRKESLVLEVILGDDRLIDLFAHHLVREYSVECLLSLIEFYQFRCRLIALLESLNEDDANDGGAQGTGIRKWSEMSLVFAPSVPHSDIVHGGEGTDILSFKGRALCLYRKYVEEGSEFEVNIGSKQRQKLRDLMHDGEEWMDDETALDVVAVATLFDDVITEMVKLLQSAKDRFQSKLAA